MTKPPGAQRRRHVAFAVCCTAALALLAVVVTVEDALAISLGIVQPPVPSPPPVPQSKPSRLAALREAERTPRGFTRNRDKVPTARTSARGRSPLPVSGAASEMPATCPEYEQWLRVTGGPQQTADTFLASGWPPEGTSPFLGYPIAARGSKKKGRTCAAVRDEWLGSVKSMKPTQDDPPRNDWALDCTEIHNVCLSNNELLVFHPNASQLEPKDVFMNPPKAKHPNQTERFEMKVVYNMPGYHDNAGQFGAQPIKVRPVAAHQDSEWDDFEHAKWEEDIAPLVLFSMYPINLQETFYNQAALKPWAEYVYEHPSMRRHPLLAAIPHNLKLPEFYNIMSPLLAPVRSFSEISRTCEDQPPLCFRQVYGCTTKRPDKWTLERVATGTNYRHWEAMREFVVRSRCAEVAASGAYRAQGEAGVLRVRFARMRGLNRRITNVDDVLRECSGAMINGVRILCEERDFTELTTDVCEMQRVDVLFTAHGAQVANSMFMRPGSSMIETRPFEWWAPHYRDGRFKNWSHWGNTMNQMLWSTNTTMYWFYGASRPETSRGPYSAMGRDDDIEVRWPKIRCMLAKILLLDGDRTKYNRLDTVTNCASDLAQSLKCERKACTLGPGEVCGLLQSSPDPFEKWGHLQGRSRRG